MTKHLDMFIGPVQGFIAQSRRTRDLWGSSYLLSFLSAHAMHGAKKAGGTIIRPIVDNDPLYLWISDEQKNGAPEMGSLPNHFVLEVDGDARCVAKAGIKAFNEAWEKVYCAVWEAFIESVCSKDNNGTKDIWDRQVKGYWEIMWTATNNTKTAEDSDRANQMAMTRRKHWRTQCPPDEPGDKCTVMHDLQELSGYIRAEGKESANKQDEFWKSLREQRPIGPLNLRDNERLCAIAFVKRMFPKITKKLDLNIDASHWHSTVHVGAKPWIHRVQSFARKEMQEYVSTIAKYQSSFKDLKINNMDDFSKIDTNYFHYESIENERLCPLDNDTGNDTRKKLSKMLKEKIYKTKDTSGRSLGPPSSFYALLLADGDSLGKLVGKLGGEVVGQALSKFTTEVPEIVKKHDGVTIYAGGDDVLAMLPVPRALSCAAKLSQCYKSAFEEDKMANAKTNASGTNATLSAAVTFAHIRLPLDIVLAESHRLLDDEAKNTNGRDSLAVGIMKSGGLQSQWVTTWMRKDTDGTSLCALKPLEDLMNQLNSFKTTNFNESTSDMGLSLALIYRIREILSLLCGWSQWKPGEWGNLPNDFEIDDFRELLRAEILHSLTSSLPNGGGESNVDSLSGLIWKLLRPSRRQTNDNTGDNNDQKTPAELGVDALMLARFLANHDSDYKAYHKDKNEENR